MDEQAERLRSMPAPDRQQDAYLFQDTGQLRGATIALRGGHVMPMDPSSDDLPGGDVLIADGRVLSVGRGLGPADIDIDCANHIVLPGFVNSHVHLFQSALRSYWSGALMSDYFTQSRHGRDAIFHHYSPDDVYLGELVGSAESLSAGVTTVVDTSQCTYTPDHTDAAIAGLRASGVRAVYAYSPTSGWDHPPDVPEHPADLERILGEHFSDRSSLVTPALGSAVDERMWKLARRHGLSIFTHVNDESAGRDLEALFNQGWLGEDNTYIHCTGLRDATWAAIRDSGGRVSLSSIVEQTLGFSSPGIHPAVVAQVPAGFSTDAPTLGPSDMFAQMKVAYVLLRSPALQPDQAAAAREVSPRAILELATLGGARAAQLESTVGSITPGKRADLVLLNRKALNSWPAHDPAAAVVSLMDTSNVSAVMVDGTMEKWAGGLLHVETTSLLDALAASAHGLLARARYPGRSPRGWRPGDPVPE